MQKTFRAFPSDRFIPEAVRPIVDKLVELRAQAEDADAAAVRLRAEISNAETADVKEAADALAAGEAVKAGSQHHDEAVKAVQAAERQKCALKAAVNQVAVQLTHAFADAAADVYEIADAEVERTTADYANAVEALVKARNAWRSAVSARRYADAVSHGRGDAHYMQPKVDRSDIDELCAELKVSPELLFAPKVVNVGAVHYASHVQQILVVNEIPSFSCGNKLTILERDYEKAIALIEARTDYYLDRGALVTDVPPRQVTIETVDKVTDGMATQCHWSPLA